MNFSIIDFETATPWRGSICAVGLIVVRNGEIVDEFYSLINPQEHIHTYHTKKVHHISDEDVANAPTFSEVWPKVVELVGEYPLGSHNNEFDMSAMQSAIAHWDVRPANFKIFDTLDLFRSVLDCPNGCGLGTIAESYGIEFKHHNAGADASATARCVLKLAAEKGLCSIADILRFYDVPQPYSILFVAPTPYVEYKDKMLKPKEPFVHVKAKDKNIPMTCGCDMDGLVVCLTGEMNYCSRGQAKELITRHGGKATTGISGKTNVLLVGEYIGYPQSYMSSKHKEALTRIENGQHIEIWHEAEFLQHVAESNKGENND